jgi:hypothetical protein
MMKRSFAMFYLLLFALAALSPTFTRSDRFATASESGRAEKTKPVETSDPPTAAPGVRFDPIVRDIEGWTVHVDPALLEGEHCDEGEKALTMLANHLQRIAILVPAGPLAKLRELDIWIEHSHPTLKTMQYHPSGRWLVDHGHDPSMIELEKGSQHHQCKQLMLRVVFAAARAGVGRKRALGNLDGLPGQRHRRTRRNASFGGGIHQQ